MRKGVEVAGKGVNDLTATRSRRTSRAGEDKRRVYADGGVRRDVGETVENAEDEMFVPWAFRVGSSWDR